MIELILVLALIINWNIVGSLSLVSVAEVGAFICNIILVFSFIMIAQNTNRMQKIVYTLLLVAYLGVIKLVFNELI